MGPGDRGPNDKLCATVEQATLGSTKMILARRCDSFAYHTSYESN
jgi:hypothetical protein